MCSDVREREREWRFQTFLDSYDYEWNRVLAVRGRKERLTKVKAEIEQVVIAF